MKPFDTATQAMDWMAKNAQGPVESYVWTSCMVIGGRPANHEPVPAADKDRVCQNGWIYW